MAKETNGYTYVSLMANLMGNSASEIPYGMYEKWYDILKYVPWPFDKMIKFFSLYKNHMNRLKRRGLYFRTRAIVVRDRIEIETFNDYSK